jgi:integrase
MNRRRSKSKSMFPPNLYESDGYFSWRNPLTGDYFGIGSNRADAFDQAIEANIRIAKMRGKPRLAERITGDRTRTVAAWEEKYSTVLDKHELTPATRSNYRTFSKRVVALFGGKAMRSVTALDVSEGLEKIAVEEGMPRTAHAVRAYMRLSFEQAIQHGWLDTNPVRITRIVGDTSVKRARLTLDVFNRVYESAPTEWLRNAMALALASAQRREDVARAEFKDFKDGGWWLTQASEKTDHPHRIFIPNDLRPAGFPLSLGEVVSQCRRTAVVARTLVHQSVRRGRSAVGGCIRLSTVSSVFSDAVEALGIDWGAKTPPTFHEIRSLAARLYSDQGVNVQALLGHSDPDTTAIYQNSRGQDYVRVTV